MVTLASNLKLCISAILFYAYYHCNTKLQQFLCLATACFIILLVLDFEETLKVLWPQVQVITITLY